VVTGVVRDFVHHVDVDHQLNFNNKIKNINKPNIWQKQ
jgi:hypothetical protein